MKKRDDREYLLHIADAIDKIQYCGVDIGAIWQYLTEDLPSLKIEVHSLLNG